MSPSPWGYDPAPKKPIKVESPERIRWTSILVAVTLDAVVVFWLVANATPVG